MPLRSFVERVRILVGLLVLTALFPIGSGHNAIAVDFNESSIDKWKDALRQRRESGRTSYLSTKTPSKAVQGIILRRRLHDIPQRLNTIPIRASHRPRQLGKTHGDLPSGLSRAISESYVVSLLYFDGETVKYDWRRPDIPEKEALWGFSMSKSVTSYLLGKAYCGNRIDSLNDQVKKYVEPIGGTFYGNARIIDALNMTTGDGKIYRSLPWALRTRANRGTRHVYQAPLLYNGWTLVEAFKAIGNAGPGNGVYNYKSPNTGAIGLVVASVAREGLGEFAGRELADDAGLKYPSKYLADPSGMPLAHGWFYATRTDWLRIGIRVAEQYHSPGCMGDYLRSAVAESVQKHEKSSFREYGKFFHLYNEGWSFPHMAMVGAHGQRLIVDLKAGRVWVIHSIRTHGSKGVVNAVVQ